MKDSILTQLLTLKGAKRPDDHLKKYSAMLEALHAEFSMRLQDFKMLESEMQMVSSPFNCSVDDAPIEIQMELTDLRSDTLLAEYFKSVSLMDCHSSLK